MNRSQQFRQSFSEKSSDPKQTGSTSGGNLLVGGILFYFFYKYWKQNPDLAVNDGRECWATEGSFSATAESTGMGDINVTQQFLTWMMFGFILYLVSEIASLIGLCGGIINSKPVLMCGGILGAPTCCGFLAFLISGMVLRWRHIGQVCSGEFEGGPMDTVPLDPTMSVYMKDTGSFMNWYLILMSIACGLVLCCAACCAMCMCGLIGAAAGAAKK